MFRTIIHAALASAACLAIAPAARADAVFTLADLSAGSINSGESFTFAIRMAGADIASYLLPVVLTGSAGSTPGVDFDLAPPAAPPAVGYVFPGPPTGNFSANLSTNPGSPTSLFLEIGDYTFGSPSDGTTDLIAWITVTTSATFVGAIDVAFGDLADFEVLNGNFDDAPFQAGRGFRVVVGAAAIPEPASVAMLAVGGLAVAGLARRRRPA